MSTYIALAWYDYCEHDSYLMLFFSSIRSSLDPFFTHLFVTRFVMLSCESFFISNICMPFIYNASDVVVSLAPLQQRHTLLQFIRGVYRFCDLNWFHSLIFSTFQTANTMTRAIARASFIAAAIWGMSFFYFLNTKQKTC